MVAMLASFVLSRLQRTIPSPASAPMAATYPDAPEGVDGRRVDGFFSLTSLTASSIVSQSSVSAHLDLREHHLAPNGYLHAAAVIAD
jgi:hypothetical protein